MPEIKLISYTGHGNPDPLYAAKLLAFTKNTRLNMTPDAFENFMRMEPETIALEMQYMATTIPSSWEFADLIFLMTKVSRATAQQITRSRNASFAMQSQRTTDMRQVSWDKRGAAHTDRLWFDDLMRQGVASYAHAVEGGMTLEDARDLLPIGAHCNLVAKYNLRALVELCRARDSLRVQGPYRSAAEQMKDEVLKVWPWAEPFFVPPHQAAIKMIEEVAAELAAQSGEKGAMFKGLHGKLAKAADLVKKG